MSVLNNQEYNIDLRKGKNTFIFIVKFTINWIDSSLLMELVDTL